MNLALVGFMGAGKSSVAVALASRKDVRAIECDERIVELCDGKSITQIFKDEGEGFFRSKESEALRLIVKENVDVISCGGGVVTQQENVQILKEHGYHIVYLDAPFELLCERVGGDPSRPLFQDREKAKELYLEREALYRECADLILPVGEQSISFIANILIQLLSSSKEGEKKESLYCVVGDPVCHSRSPRIHNAAFETLEDERYYFAWRLGGDECKKLCDLMRKGALAGVSVTMPLKEVLLEQVDELTDAAQAIGALNTLYLQDGKVVGDNTDWSGIVRSIEEQTPLVGKKVGVLGAGGTARAAAYAVKEKGDSLYVFNRTQEKAQKLAKQFGGATGELSDEEQIRSCDILIQTTSVGMKPHEEQSVVPAECFRSGQVVLDLVYAPKETRFLLFAKNAGAKVIYGDRVFLWQGVRQSEIFSGGKAPVEVMKRALSL